MRRLITGIASGALALGLVAGPALAAQCPLLIKQVNDAAGNRLEAPWLCGAVARMGAAAGVATPVNATLYAALKPWCAGTPR